MALLGPGGVPRKCDDWELTFCLFALHIHMVYLHFLADHGSTMKVKIEIEVSQEEMPIAAELLQTLKQLAAHVETKVKRTVPDTQTNLQKFTAMIQSVEDDDGKKLEDVASRIQKMFDDHGDEQLLWDFFEAFTAVVLEGDLVCSMDNIRWRYTVDHNLRPKYSRALDVVQAHSLIDVVTNSMLL